MNKKKKKEAVREVRAKTEKKPKTAKGENMPIGGKQIDDRQKKGGKENPCEIYVETS